MSHTHTHTHTHKLSEWILLGKSPRKTEKSETGEKERGESATNFNSTPNVSTKAATPQVS